MADPAQGEAGSLLLNQPVVIDNGSSSIKAGFAGSSKPKLVLDTKVGRSKHMRIMPGGALEEENNGGIFVGRKLDEHRGAFLLEHPMDQGQVTAGGWDAMERLWEHVYSKHCLNAKQEEHPVLLTEAPLNHRQHREQMAQIFFETLQAPALFFTAPSVLSLYASARTTGVVLDVGEGVTHCVPVYEGHALPHSVVRSNVAGRDVTNYLQRTLRRGAGLTLTTTAEADLCKTMKEQVCYLTPTATMSATAGTAGSSIIDEGKDEITPYQLPDGQTVDLGRSERLAPKVLFDPSLIGSEEPGCADVLCNAILKSDRDLRAKFYGQVVVSGGSTLTPGFGDCLLAHCRQRAPAHTAVRISAPPERLYSPYVGGSILASLSTFKNMWVSRAEYDEYGPNVLHRSEL